MFERTCYHIVTTLNQYRTDYVEYISIQMQYIEVFDHPLTDTVITAHNIITLRTVVQRMTRDHYTG